MDECESARLRLAGPVALRRSQVAYEGFWAGFNRVKLNPAELQFGYRATLQLIAEAGMKWAALCCALIMSA